MSGRRVLIVEDRTDDAESMAMLLGLYGFETLSTKSRVEAVNAAHAFKPCVAVVDLGLPGCDGTEVVRALATLSDGLAVVVVTGHTNPDRLSRAKDAGAKRVFIKPADPVELVAYVEEHCETDVDAAVV